MVPSASVSPVREILESRLTKVLLDLDSALEAHFSAQVAAELERDAELVTFTWLPAWTGFELRQSKKDGSQELSGVAIYCSLQ